MSEAEPETSDGGMDSIHSSEIGDILSNISNGIASFLALDRFDANDNLRIPHQ